MLDEAVELARVISSGNKNAFVFTLLPQHHGSIENTTVVSRRRSMEDRLMAFLASTIFDCAATRFSLA